MNRLGTMTLIFLFSGLLWAADIWQGKDYTTWTQKDCEQMLTKSPWAFQYVHTNFDRPANISAVPTPIGDSELNAGRDPQSGARESRIIFQLVLATAKPIRMARAQLSMLQSAEMKAQAEQFVNQPVGKEIVVQLQYASRPPGISAIHDIQNFFRRATINDFQGNTSLTSSDRKQPVQISRYEQPNERNPFGLLVFPRLDEAGNPLFTGKEKSITLRCDLKISERGGHVNYSIFVKMEPRKMMFQNEFSLWGFNKGRAETRA